MTAGSRTPADSSHIDGMLSAAQKDLSNCVFANAWTFTILGVAGSVPASIYLKTYSPLIAASVLGSGADYIIGVHKCRDLQERVREIEKMKAYQTRQQVADQGSVPP
jgi:hypothetical protein